MGDARLKLKEDVDRKYALLLVDAFSSDSIPIHLLTVEAVALYMDRLQEDGMLALHKPDAASVSQWFRQLLERKPRKLAAVALANKMARVIWAMMARGEAYRRQLVTTA